MTPADFATLCPLMAEEDQPSVQRYIDSAVPHFDIERWGAFYAEGLAYYVAHQITVQRELEHSRGDTAIVKNAFCDVSTPDCDDVFREIGHCHPIFVTQIEEVRI